MRPSSVVVIGQTFSIQYHHLADVDDKLIWGDSEVMKVAEDMMGYTNSALQEIHVKAEPLLGFDAERDTTLHEALHALFAVTGLDEKLSEVDAEDVISRLAPAMLDMIRSNPILVNYLKEMPHG